MRSPPVPALGRGILMLLAALGAGRVAMCAEPPAEASQSALQACARIATAAERLACYDRLAGPAAQNSPAPQAKAPAVGATAAATGATAAAAAPAAAPSRATPSAQGAQATPPAQAPAASALPAASAAGAAAAAPGAAGAAASASAPAPQSFGLYAEEHPKPAVAPSLEANVVAVGRSAGGRMTVALEGGALWELDGYDSDPLLAVGDAVTITRATLGSYLLHTPSHRTYRVRRLH